MSAWGASFGVAWGDSWGASAVETGHAQPSGGGSDSKRRGFHYPIEELERFDVPAPVAEVIAEVAQQQALQPQGEVDYTAQLLAALNALGIEWQRRYDEALTAMREAYIQQQVALAVGEARQEDEYWGAAVTLLLLH